MPHKYKSDGWKGDPSFYDLPPTKLANLLPTKATQSGINTTKPVLKFPKRKRPDPSDDTPRAFTRLFHPPRSGLDDGIRPQKKQKISKPTTGLIPPRSQSPPKILPHEPLSSFAVRVDAALPFSCLTGNGRGGKQAGGHRQTKTEKKMQRMQREWREEEKRRRERRVDDMEENMDEDRVDAGLEGAKKTKGKGRKRKRVDGKSDGNEDPWAHVEAKKIGDVGSGVGLIGLHDVVLAPPKLSRLSIRKDVVNSTRDGGLKRQGELKDARNNVIEKYRQMTTDKRGVQT